MPSPAEIALFPTPQPVICFELSEMHLKDMVPEPEEGKSMLMRIEVEA